MTEKYISPITTGESIPSRRVAGAPPVKRREPEQSTYKPSHTLRNVFIAGSAVVVAGGGIYAAYENIPAVHRFVDQQFLQRIGLKDPEVPLTFDNNEKGKSIFGESNVEKITIQDAQKEGLLKPKMEMVTKDQVKVVLPLPGIFNDSEQIQTVTLSKELNLRAGIDPNTIAMIARQMKDLPIGYPLTLPEGFHYAAIADENNPDLIKLIIAFRYFPDQDITMSIGYGAQGGFSPLSGTQPISQEEYNNKYNISFGHDYESLPDTSGIDKIGALSQESDILYITMDAFTGKKVTFSKTTGKYNHVKLDVDYTTTPNTNKLFAFTTPTPGNNISSEH